MGKKDSIDRKSALLWLDIFTVTNTWQDLNTDIKGNTFTQGFGINHWKDFCARTVALLSKGIEAKSAWVVENPQSDSHALACSQRFYAATYNYINAINDIPNNAPVPSKQPMSGPDDEGVANVLGDEPEPPEVDAVAIYKAMLMMDHIAAPEEPILDTN